MSKSHKKLQKKNTLQLDNYTKINFTHFQSIFISQTYKVKGFSQSRVDSRGDNAFSFRYWNDISKRKEEKQIKSFGILYKSETTTGELKCHVWKTLLFNIKSKVIYIFREYLLQYSEESISLTSIWPKRDHFWVEVSSGWYSVWVSVNGFV